MNQLFNIIDDLTSNTTCYLLPYHNYGYPENQQISQVERHKYFNNLLHQDPYLFLERYGNHLSPLQLSYFEKYHDYEVQFILNQLIKENPQNNNQKKKLQKEKNQKIRNRRYKFISLLRSNVEFNSTTRLYKDYFNDIESRLRDPVLYDNLIGKYSTSPVTNINTLRPDEDHPISNLIMNSLEALESSRDRYDDNIEDNDRYDNNIIQDDEILLFRKQYIDIIQNRFMNGKDKYFDYNIIDNDESFDDNDMIENDLQEKYFETD